MNNLNKQYLLYTTKDRSVILQVSLGIFLPIILFMVFANQINQLWLAFLVAFFWFFLIKFLIKRTLVRPVRVVIKEDSIQFERLSLDLGISLKILEIKFNDIVGFSSLDIGIDTLTFKLILSDGRVVKLKKDIRYSKKDDFESLTQDFTEILKSLNQTIQDKDQTDHRRIKFGDNSYLDFSTYIFVLAALALIWPISGLINSTFELHQLLITVLFALVGLLYRTTHKKTKSQND